MTTAVPDEPCLTRVDISRTELDFIVLILMMNLKCNHGLILLGAIKRLIGITSTSR
jgi:hypothetical protein